MQDQSLSVTGFTHVGQPKDLETTDERRRSRLPVVASDLSDRTMLALPRDASRGR